MSDLPPYVTFEEVGRACEALGITPSQVSRLVIDGSSGIEATIGDGSTVHIPIRWWSRSAAEGEFDTSPETLQRLREALRRTPDRP